MSLIIQKYGKAYVASVEKLQTLAQHIRQTVRVGNSVVVVVPAMTAITERWSELADEISVNPYLRERNTILAAGEQVAIALLSMTLQELGQPAISLTGTQIGIVTEAESTGKRILHIQTERIERYLNEGKVVVISGFEGIVSAKDMAITLGNVVTDTSAVALAAKLRASHCEIYTDQLGLFTTAPQIVQNAHL
jgi:aspartate kinase